MYSNRMERFHFQLSWGICVFGLYLFLLSLGIIQFASVHNITLPRNVRNFLVAAAKYLRYPCGEQFTPGK